MGEGVLVPVDVATVAASLVILECIGQHTAIGTDAEVVAGVGGKDDSA